MTWPDTRRAGVCLHFSSLPGRFGIGELGGAAFAFIDRLVEMNISVWQFLPLGPTAYADSPYQPLSSFAGNPLLIDIAELVHLGLLSAGEVRPLTRLPRNEVEYGHLIPAKNTLLARAAARFAAGAVPSLRSGYAAFVERHDTRWLHDYALFRVLKSRHRERAWPDWPARFRDRDPAALHRFATENASDIEAIKIGQFLFEYQWRALQRYARERDVLLFGDVPIYIALDSADAWSHRELLLLDDSGQPRLVAGVPPDYFSADGQLWGNPIYDWDYHERTGYGWWIERCAYSMRRMDLVRVDHFRGFAGYWAVPQGAPTAREGSWQPGPGQKIFAALEAALGPLPIVAEDLGVITPDVIALRVQYDIPGMVVLQFDAAAEDFDPDAIDEHSVCYTGTHDNDTTVGWFAGGPGDIRTPAQIRHAQQIALANTGGSARSIHLDLIRLAYSSPARIAMVPLQDFLGLGSEARMNTPGVEGGNWRWRFRSAQLDPALVRRCAQMSAASERDRSK